MARKAILDTYYTFTPSTRTVVIPRVVPRERLILITDVTTNQVLYNFSDAGLTATSYVVAPSSDNSTYTTTITLNYNTTGLSATDKLQIIVDEYDEKFTPSESYLDPVNKLRVSTPQSLIDTDFEYSTQQTKWEQLSLTDNRPFAFYSSATGNLTLSNVLATFGSRTYTANVFPVSVYGSTLLTGNAITILDTNYAGADGTYMIDSNPDQYNLTYTGKYYYTSNVASIFNPASTVAFLSNTYSNAAIGVSSIGNSGNLITVVTSQVHGFVVGNEIGLTGVTAATSNPPNGSWTVSTIGNSTAFSFYTIAAPVGALTATNASLYARPIGQTLHRPLQAGIRFSHNSVSHNNQYIRQSRRYFRYQSGKGIQMSTGTTMKSNFVLDALSSSGTTVTVKTKDQHNINHPFGSPGVSIYITGANETAYNGTFTVDSVVDPYTFTYTAASIPSATPASGQYSGGISSWYGSAIRTGLFDSQNGVFFEFDGQQMYAVRRTSTGALPGTIAVNIGSTTVTGTGTSFSRQLITGDYIVIHGMSYRIRDILSDTTLTITPQYRGLINLTNALYSKTVDTKYPQSAWNIDRCDGTGPSGFKQDFTRMQMFYIDYSWYGAGFIRFGFRGSNGDVIYCHRIVNNNVQQVAYMRSGNLPARYETNSFANATVLSANLIAAATSMTLSYIPNNWPSSGTLLLRNNTNSEYVSYSSYNTTTNTVTLNYRGQPGATQIATYTSGNPVITTANTVNLQPGMAVLGNGIPAQSYIGTIVANTSITLTTAPFWSNTQPLIFAPLASVASTWTANTQAPVSVENHSPQFAAEVNHWGTSAIMDGGFTPDKAFIFTKGMTNFANVYAGQSNAIMSFRVAPSAAQGLPGAYIGAREIVNRMQMIPFELDAYSNGSFLMQVILNGQVSSSQPGWQNVGGSSLAQYQFHSANTSVQGGEPIFGFYMNTTGYNLPGGPGIGNTYNTTQQDLTQIRDLGTSILGGGQSSGNVAIYPDGPDVLTIVATNITPSTTGGLANLVARLSWTEAQA